jgi:hypothetical protein
MRGPEHRSVGVALAVVALAQTALAWLWPPTSPAFHAWFSLLT